MFFCIIIIIIIVLKLHFETLNISMNIFINILFSIMQQMRVIGIITTIYSVFYQDHGVTSPNCKVNAY